MRAAKRVATCVPSQQRRFHALPNVALDLVRDAGVPTAPYKSVSSVSDASQAFEDLGGSEVYVRANVTSAYGRRPLATSGSFGNGALRGTAWAASSAKEATELAKLVIGHALELQDAPTGLEVPCNSVSIVRSAVSPKQRVRVLYYCDRTHGQPGVIATKLPDADGTLPYIAETRANDAVSEIIPMAKPLAASDGARIASALGLSGKVADSFGAAMSQAYANIFLKLEALRLELVVDINGEEAVVSDAHVQFDPFALPRHKELIPLRETAQEHAGELKAEEAGLFYIKLGPKDNKQEVRGDIGTFGYGAGLAMATCDAVVAKGGVNANFLDGGGGANESNARLSVLTLANDPDVKAIFVNIFGGLTRCDWVAEGIVNAIAQSDRLKSGKVPIIVRLLGNKSEIGRKHLQDSGYNLQLESDFQTAAKKVVDAARALKRS